jgi:hypothetical protein
MCGAAGVVVGAAILALIVGGTVGRWQFWKPKGVLFETRRMAPWVSRLLLIAAALGLIAWAIGSAQGC